MPDVGLTSNAEPLSPEYKVIIKYSVEVDGLAVYTETYDAEKLRKELEADEKIVKENWFRRIYCVVGCRTVEVFRPVLPGAFWMVKPAMKATSRDSETNVRCPCDLTKLHSSKD